MYNTIGTNNELFLMVNIIYHIPHVYVYIYIYIYIYIEAHT